MCVTVPSAKSEDGLGRLEHRRLTACALQKEDQIDKKTLEISQVGDEVYKNMQDLSDELPDNSPRYVLLSYPLTLVSRSHRSRSTKLLVVWEADTG